MTNERLAARIRYTQQQLTEVSYALALLEQQRAVKQANLNAWHQNSLARLNHTKAKLTFRLKELDASKPSKKHA